MIPLNYRSIFNKPIIINSIAEFILPFSLELKRCVMMIPSAGFLYGIYKFFQLVTPFQFNSSFVMIYFFAGTYLISDFLSEEYDFLDNKNLLYFIYNYLKYFFKIQVGKRTLTNNEIMKDLYPEIRFSSAKL
jgi:hypothetical protein